MNRPEALEAVLFDLDGTLIASHDALWDAYAAFMNVHRLEPTRDEFDRLDGASLAGIVETLSSDHAIGGPIDALVVEYRAFVSERYATAGPIGGADEILTALAARLRLGLVTSAPRDLVEAALRHRGWVALFAEIVTGDDGAAKPDPELYRMCLTRLGVAEERALAVEDARNGVVAAAAAGLMTIGLASSPARQDELRRAGAAEVISDLTMLAAVIA